MMNKVGGTILPDVRFYRCFVCLVQTQYKELEKQRNLDRLTRQMQEAIVQRRRDLRRSPINDRRAAEHSRNPLEDNGSTITQPPQTTASPPSKVSSAEQRRKNMEDYQKYGAIRKPLFMSPAPSSHIVEQDQQSNLKI